MLFDEWYIAKQTRQSRLGKLKVLADEKKQLRQTPPQALLGAPVKGEEAG